MPALTMSAKGQPASGEDGGDSADEDAPRTKKRKRKRKRPEAAKSGKAEKKARPAKERTGPGGVDDRDGQWDQKAKARRKKGGNPHGPPCERFLNGHCPYKFCAFSHVPKDTAAEK